MIAQIASKVVSGLFNTALGSVLEITAHYVSHLWILTLDRMAPKVSYYTVSQRIRFVLSDSVWDELKN